MATIEDSQQQEIKDLASVEENTSNIRESTPLLINEGQSTWARMQSKFHCRHNRCCLTSKAAILILLWNLILVADLESLLDPSILGVQFGNIDSLKMTILSVSTYSIVGFLFLFYPLAGCLADIRWGRYKTVVYSVRVIWGSLVVMVVLGGVATASIVIPMIVKLVNDLDIAGSLS